MDVNDYPKNYFNYERGWAHTNPGWYEVTVKNGGTYSKIHDSCIEWLYNNIDNPERHVRWVSFLDKSIFRFRYERDYIWFRLAWE